ncbi:hypothetical protein U91I_03498 [alpha proteobacterium U9-1i]|nr:hypothetical protein U91I_03498 [alpha proteobacterium U9-1i]
MIAEVGALDVQVWVMMMSGTAITARIVVLAVSVTIIARMMLVNRVMIVAVTVGDHRCIMVMHHASRDNR